MAITTTPLGFKKPDGRELVSRIDNVISENADTAEREIQKALTLVKTAVTGPPGKDGSNVIPTAKVIADEIKTPGTLANTALSATFAVADLPAAAVANLARNAVTTAPRWSA